MDQNIHKFKNPKEHFFRSIYRKSLLVNANRAMFKLYHGENKLHFNQMMMSALY